MRSLQTSGFLGCFLVAALLAASPAARASDATMLADRAGFLVGHALRCGVAEGRLTRSAALIGELIDAYARDSDDRTAAQSVFAERVVASVTAKPPGQPLPSCASVRTQLTRFEQHRQIARRGGASPETVAGNAGRPTPPTRNASAVGSGNKRHGPRMAALLVR